MCGREKRFTNFSALRADFRFIAVNEDTSVMGTPGMGSRAKPHAIENIYDGLFLREHAGNNIGGIVVVYHDHESFIVMVKDRFGSGNI